jgi:hypothetical protein
MTAGKSNEKTLRRKVSYGDLEEACCTNVCRNPFRRTFDVRVLECGFVNHATVIRIIEQKVN